MSNKKSYDILVKLLLIGDSGVGKSCLLLRFCQDEFTPSFISTIGIDFKIRTAELDGQTAKFQVWDTAGQERFKTITIAYYRSAMGFLLTYDVTDEKSFQSIRTWYQDVKNNARENVEMILVGNKKDMADKRVVSYEQGKALADELGIPFMEASAKTAEGVDEAFLQLARMVKDNVYNQDEETIKVNNQNAPANKGCCS